MASILKEFTDAAKLADSEGLSTKLNTRSLTGLSGNKVIGVLQRLLHVFSGDPHACYLEVGVFRGLTLISVAKSCPALRCYGIDNFAQFDPDNTNLDMVKNNARQLGVDNLEVVNMDYEDAFENLNDHISDKKIAVYFVDGPHDYRSQRMCLELALPYLHEHAVVVVDDSNYEHVRQANRDFLVTHPEWALLCEAYTERHPLNMGQAGQEAAREGWWNGINIVVRDKQNKLRRRYPPTGRSRQLCGQEHILFSSKVAELFPEALKLAAAIYNVNIYRMLEHFVKFNLASLRHRRQNKALFKEMNTYSAGLPHFRCYEAPFVSSSLSAERDLRG